MEWQAARAPDRRYRVVCILQASPSRPGAICGLLFFELASWPTRRPSRRDHCGGSAPPLKGSVYRAPLCAPVNTRRCRTSGQKGGALPPPSPVSCGAPGEAGTRGAQLRYVCRRGRGESVPTRVQYGFPGKAPTTAARTGPSESGALGLLKSRATFVRHQAFVSGALIRRHGLDPRRRKLSIHPAPAEAASWLLSTAVP